MNAVDARQARKEEAKKLKRKRIEESGGVRPRNEKNAKAGKSSISSNSDEVTTSNRIQRQLKSSVPKQDTSTTTVPEGRRRFGRVMEQVPCPSKPRTSTLSIAVPGSVVSNAQTRELRTQLVGQIARAATVYHVDEIIVFDDKLSQSENTRGYYHHREQPRRVRPPHDESKQALRSDECETEPRQLTTTEGDNGRNEKYCVSDAHTFMARVFQYCECPQYLRRHFFPMHPDLQFAGLLPPLDAPHHVRAGEKSKYREGVVLEKKRNGCSLVNCGIHSRPVEIDRELTPGIRCTVKLDVNAYSNPGKIIKGVVVSPSAPREDDGTYWGYTTRLASSIDKIFSESPYGDGYDLKIGTSERGDVTVDDKNFELPKFRHSLIVFGGVAGIEECVDADESLELSGNDSKNLFDMWVNTCPFQGSRTIRTEEAVFISLARLRPYIIANNSELSMTCTNIEFSDEDPSDESSEN